MTDNKCTNVDDAIEINTEYEKEWSEDEEEWSEDEEAFSNKEETSIAEEDREDEEFSMDEEFSTGEGLGDQGAQLGQIDIDRETYEQPTDKSYLWGDTPVLGMSFDTVDEAYEFYNAYGRCKGFSIRINNSSVSRKKDKPILMQMLCRSKEGKRKDPPQFNSPQKPRPITRVGYKARFIIRLQKDKKYELTQFVEEHNHSLAKPTEAHFLRSQRGVEDSKGGLIKTMYKAGIGPAKIHSFLRTEAGGSQNLNITKDDCSNFVQRHRRSVIKGGDARTLQKYFMKLKAEDPSFFYTFKLDENDRLASCFWCDSRSKIDYSFFSDVLCFDTTYKTNGYDLPYAPFVGVNHHGQSILFGCGLIFRETTESFIWLFEAFLEAMDGKKPGTIFSDQAQAIGNAIKHVFPDSHHRLCLWHIYQNAGKNLAQVYHDHKGFQKSFENVVYHHETEEQFEAAWKKLLEDYNLQDNTWLLELYSKKEKWALVYGRQYFCAGITTTQRSESMNSYFKRILHRKLLLFEFVTKYEDAVSGRRDEEISQDSKSRQREPILKSRWTVEKEAAEKYTYKIFQRFQEELVEGWNLFAECIKEEETMFTYSVFTFGNRWQQIVTFDSSDDTVKYSCKWFEFTGILCSHALKVLHTRQMRNLPQKYYLHRWTKDATSGIVLKESKTGAQPDPKSSLSSRYSSLAHVAMAFAVKAATIEESSELGMEVLMQGMKKIDDCLETNGGKIRKIVEVDEENDIIQEEPTIKINDPLRKKGKDDNYGRPKGALEKRKKTSNVQQNKSKEPPSGEQDKTMELDHVQQNPGKKRATKKNTNQSEPTTVNGTLPLSTSTQVSQHMISQNLQTYGASNPQLRNFGNPSMIAQQVNLQTSGIQGAYNPHLCDSRSIPIRHLLSPNIVQQVTPQASQNQGAQNLRNFDNRNMAVITSSNRQTTRQMIPQSSQVQDAHKYYSRDSGRIPISPFPPQAPYAHFYGDSASMYMTPSLNQSATSQEPLVPISGLFQPGTNDMQSTQSLLSLLSEQSRPTQQEKNNSRNIWKPQMS